MGYADAWAARPSVRFFVTLTRAVPGPATAWWLLLGLRSLVPAALTIATGRLVGAVSDGTDLTGPLTLFGVVFVVSQVGPPVHQVVGTLLGHRFSSVLNDRLMAATLAPDGIGHLERSDLGADLTTARDFDLGQTAPPMFMNIDFVADGLVTLFAGIASALVLVAFAWWAPVVLALAWGSTHWLLRESGVWRDRNTDEVRIARRHAAYAYDLATEPGPAKEVRLFGLASWLDERFTRHRLRLHDLQYEATRLRERSILGALVVVLAANLLVLGVLARRGYAGDLALGDVVTFAGAAFGASAIAFGGLSWALDGAAAPVAAIADLEPAMREAGRLTVGPVVPPAGTRPATAAAPEIRFRDVTFAYPGSRAVLGPHFDLTIPAGRSLAVVGQNGAGKTTLAKLLCRLYDPTAGAIEIDGVDLRDLDPEAWRRHLAAVFQDFVRYELTLRENVAVRYADDSATLAALERAGAADLAELDVPLAKGYPHGIDLSCGQWQRVALARAIASVASGADVVLLDEPTAMLDVRGESEIFRRMLEATVGSTTLLISHRFSTVRLADRICVVGLGDEPRLDDRAAVAAALDRAGADAVVDTLRDGLDSQLGPSWDDGVDVSFGQWQRLALARGYMRPDPLLLVLDEPTAALDAETEHALFERFASGARSSTHGHGGVTILVSHRFSTVRSADLIVVLDGARVAEVGSHEDLMGRGGPYAELYTIQAAAYS